MRRGERERGGQGPVGQAARSGQRELIKIRKDATAGVRAEDVGDRRLIQAQRVLGLAGGAGRPPQ